jgi:O-antigen ligase
VRLDERRPEPSHPRSNHLAPLKTILFIALFATATLGCFWTPVLGVLGYIAHYSIGPERQWWFQSLRGLPIRYSYSLAMMTLLGIALHWKDLRYGVSLLIGHERTILAFLGVVWLGMVIGEKAQINFIVDHPAIKFTKVIMFVMMLTHVITTPKRLDRLLWVWILCALVLGLQAYTTPRSSFTEGRLEGVGGPDFRDANSLAAYMAALLPIIGVQFMRSGWKGKLLCLFTGAFAADTIVLTRSRGAVVGLCVGVLAGLAMAPSKHRAKVIVGVLVAVFASWSLTDEAFVRRASTIASEEEQRDASAQSRIEVWKGGAKMFGAQPWGVGPGNFYQAITRYTSDGVRRDAHNSYVRCACELGFQGIILFGLIVLGAIRMLRRNSARARTMIGPEHDQFLWLNYGLVISIFVLLGCSLTMTLLYMEGTWWFLALPICLHRAMDNAALGNSPQEGTISA